MSRPSRSVVIVGAGLAALRTAETLRRLGFEGAVTIVGAEDHPPYDRPPLSKAVLTGERDAHSTVYRPAEAYADLGVELRLGRPANRLDLDGRAVRVGAEWLPFTDLVICTGGSPRMLPAASGLDGVHALRTVDDALALRRELEAGPRVIVVGAGFIGAEVASSARSLGLHVTVVEAAPTPLTRVLGEAMGAACSRLHERGGADLRCGVGISAVQGVDRVERVVLDDGAAIDCDLLVVGIGVEPATGWLEGSGVRISDGVVCDETLSVGHPGVYAAGDVASWPNPLFGGRRMRCEQWTNAAEQGRHIARTIVEGAPVVGPFTGSNYFWSDQYGSRLQFAGVTEADEIRVMDASQDDDRFLACYRAGDRLVGALALDDPRRLMQAKLLIERRASWGDAIEALAAGGDRQPRAA